MTIDVTNDATKTKFEIRLQDSVALDDVPVAVKVIVPVAHRLFLEDVKGRLRDLGADGVITGNSDYTGEPKFGAGVELALRIPHALLELEKNDNGVKQIIRIQELIQNRIFDEQGKYAHYTLAASRYPDATAPKLWTKRVYSDVPGTPSVVPAM